MADRELMETGGKCVSGILRRGGSRHFVEAVPVRFLVVDEAGGCHVRWLNLSRRMRIEVRWWIRNRIESSFVDQRGCLA